MVKTTLDNINLEIILIISVSFFMINYYYYFYNTSLIKNFDLDLKLEIMDKIRGFLEQHEIDRFKELIYNKENLRIILDYIESIENFTSNTNLAHLHQILNSILYNLNTFHEYLIIQNSQVGTINCSIALSHLISYNNYLVNSLFTDINMYNELINVLTNIFI